MRPWILCSLVAALVAAFAAVPARAQPAQGRLADWLQAARGVPDQRLLPGMRARRYEVPGLQVRLPDWPVVDADLRGARGHLELSDRRLGRSLQLRWLAARPGQLEELVRAWVVEAGEAGRTLDRPSPVRVGKLPGLEVVGRVVRGADGALAPRRDRSHREHHWFWYDPAEARVHTLHLTLPGGDVVLGERLGAPLLAGLEAGAVGPPPALAPGIATWTARVMGLQLDLPTWASRPKSRLLRKASDPAAWFLTASGNAGRRLLVAARADGAASIRLEWRPMPREKTAEQTPVPSPADPAGAAHDSWSICGHPARRTRFDQALDKAIRWSQQVAWYCPETLSEYRLGVTADEDYAGGLALVDEVPERVRCHLPAARGWKPQEAARPVRVGE